MDFFKKLFGSDKSQSLKSLSSSLIVLAGPGPESEKRETLKSLQQKSAKTVILLCKSPTDLQNKLAKYEKSNVSDGQLFYYLNAHPYGKEGILNWINRFSISLNNEIGKIKKTHKLNCNPEVTPHVWGDYSCTFHFTWDNVDVDEISVYFSAIETAYSTTSWK